MKIGLIARCDNSGLGTMSWEFYNNLPISRVLVYDTKRYASFPARFPGARVTTKITQDDLDWLMTDIDILITIETPYEWNIYLQARKRGIKTVLIPMYECEPKPLPALPDMIVCPSKLDFDIFNREIGGQRRVIMIPTPVNRQRLPFKLRKRARVFQHNAGHGGLVGRNGTTELLAAIPMLKSDAKVVIYSQKKIDFIHPKVDIRIGNFENYWSLWRGESDVFIFPHKYDGLSLPVQEALSVGMPVLSTSIYPFSMWLPQNWFFDAQETMNLRVFSRMIDVAVIQPDAIARKIDEWYDMDISQESIRAGKLAEAISWDNLKHKYLTEFENLCKNTA